MGTWKDDPARNPLCVHARNVTSQFGEDGIIARVLDVIGSPVGWAVEFGAHDGLTNCNTHALAEERGFRRVLIEPEPARFAQLSELVGGDGRVTPIQAFVGWGEGDTLDDLLDATDCPEEFDVLSVDIDGNDYHAWNAVRRYRPRVVIVEFNPTVPTDVEFVQPADGSINWGSSARSIAGLGREKGYELVATTPVNCIFVRREYFPLFGIADNRIETMRTHTACITQMFHGYDGRVFFVGHRGLVWHQLPLDEEKMQPLPDYLRKYPEHLGEREQATLRRIRAMAHGETPEPKAVGA